MQKISLWGADENETDSTSTYNGAVITGASDKQTVGLKHCQNLALKACRPAGYRTLQPGYFKLGGKPPVPNSGNFNF